MKIHKKLFIKDFEKYWSKEIMKRGHIILTRGLKTKEIQRLWMPVNVEKIKGKKYNQTEFKVEYKKIIPQFDKIIKELKKDKFSRQLILSNWNSKKPCNSQLHFLYRDNKLDLIVYSRSIEVKRWKEDILMLTHILRLIAKKSKLKVGKIYQFIASLHIYLNE